LLSMVVAAVVEVERVRLAPAGNMAI
jgi:hypothetical protein